MGIAVNENRDGTVTMSAITCLKSTPRYFGLKRLTADDVLKGAMCSVVLPAQDVARGTQAVYHRTLEKLYVQGKIQQGQPPELDVLALYAYKPDIQNLTWIPKTSHWIITAAEELLLATKRKK